MKDSIIYKINQLKKNYSEKIYDKYETSLANITFYMFNERVYKPNLSLINLIVSNKIYEQLNIKQRRFSILSDIRIDN